jgi:indolepyruvate ferredoxin oxidoreductase beta subunit
VKRQLIICGLGGQGTVFLSRVLAEAAIADGHEVLTSETHGMAQRGGAVDSHLKLGGYFGSVVRPGHADAVLVLDESRLGAAWRLLRDGGACIVNAEAGELAGAHTCNAFRIAQAIGNPRAVNLVLLGFAVAVRPDLFPSREACLRAVERLSPPAAREKNVAAFEQGCARKEAQEASS